MSQGTSIVWQLLLSLINIWEGGKVALASVPLFTLHLGITKLLVILYIYIKYKIASVACEKTLTIYKMIPKINVRQLQMYMALWNVAKIKKNIIDIIL